MLIKFGCGRDVFPAAAAPVADPDSPERLVRFVVRVVTSDMYQVIPTLAGALDAR